MTALLLTLDGTLYQLQPAGGGGWTLLALQGKRVGASYTVSGTGWCNCPDAQFRGNRNCKHVSALRLPSVGLLPAVVEEAVERSANA